MQSSPPTRAYQRPASPTESQYEFDLAALDADSRSGASSPALPTQQVDRILSEDIDGPSDFTQNLEKWMRGGTLNSRFNTVNNGLQSIKEKDNNSRGTLLPAWQAPGDEEGDNTGSHHTPPNSPPKESVFLQSRQVAVDNDTAGSSEWDPYAEAATPHPPPHKHFLQPSVEDYNSEFTSHPRLSLSSQRKSHRKGSSPGRPSSETISPVRSPVRSPIRSPVFERHNGEVARMRQDHAAEMERLERELERERSAHSRVASELQAQLQTHEEDAVRTRQAHAADLQRMNQEMDRMRTRHDREMSELRERSQKQDDESARLKEAHAAEMRQLKQELELVRLERENDVQALQRESAELTVQLPKHEAEATQLRQDHALEMRRMKQELERERSNHSEELRAVEHDLQEQLRLAALESERLKSAKKAADETTNNIRAEMSLVRQTQDEENTRFTGDHRRAVNMAQDLQAQLKDLREQLRAQQAAHESELESMRTTVSVPAPETASTREVERLRAELDSKQASLNDSLLEFDSIEDKLNSVQTVLNTTLQERNTYRDRLKALQVELDNSKDELADKEAVNVQLDAKISRALKKREMYWREKYEKMEKDREVMGKELFRLWGREECGIADESKGDLQKYRYKYVKKDGATTVKVREVSEVDTMAKKTTKRLSRP